MPLSKLSLSHRPLNESDNAMRKLKMDLKPIEEIKEDNVNNEKKEESIIITEPNRKGENEEQSEKLLGRVSAIEIKLNHASDSLSTEKVISIFNKITKKSSKDDNINLAEIEVFINN